MDKYVKRILEASVYEVADETPLDLAPALSERLGCDVYLKREDLQPIFSFKLRGAFNRMRKLSEKEKRKGVITASAGNHAQGVALAARELGIPAYIVMGENTPEIKTRAVNALGATALLHGDNYDEASEHALALSGQKGYTYIHPFDDPDVIAGQGTIGMEILRQHDRDIDAIFVPVGGGGLIGGIGAFVKYLKPKTRIVGVECTGSDCMSRSLKRGRRILLPIDELDQFADGTAVRQVGRETYRLARRVIDEMITVSIEEICAAIKDIFEDTRSIS
ncbi:MAG: pyridoxal-phosphate dependent enzyme, partial [Gammaproteobacteria bacterium]|nr:pyridoxal-phosphate dependent enzyme [Gammaproteobacteria bacterium]